MFMAQKKHFIFIVMAILLASGTEVWATSTPSTTEIPAAQIVEFLNNSTGDGVSPGMSSQAKEAMEHYGITMDQLQAAVYQGTSAVIPTPEAPVIITCAGRDPDQLAAVIVTNAPTLPSEALNGPVVASNNSVAKSIIQVPYSNLPLLADPNGLTKIPVSNAVLNQGVVKAQAEAMVDATFGGAISTKDRDRYIQAYSSNPSAYANVSWTSLFMQDALLNGDPLTVQTAQKNINGVSMPNDNANSFLTSVFGPSVNDMSLAEKLQYTNQFNASDAAYATKMVDWAIDAARNSPSIEVRTAAVDWANRNQVDLSGATNKWNTGATPAFYKAITDGNNHLLTIPVVVSNPVTPIAKTATSTSTTNTSITNTGTSSKTNTTQPNLDLTVPVGVDPNTYANSIFTDSKIRAEAFDKFVKARELFHFMPEAEKEEFIVKHGDPHQAFPDWVTAQVFLSDSNKAPSEDGFNNYVKNKYDEYVASVNAQNNVRKNATYADGRLVNGTLETPMSLDSYKNNWKGVGLNAANDLAQTEFESFNATKMSAGEPAVSFEEFKKLSGHGESWFYSTALLQQQATVDQVKKVFTDNIENRKINGVAQTLPASSVPGSGNTLNNATTAIDTATANIVKKATTSTTSVVAKNFKVATSVDSLFNGCNFNLLKDLKVKYASTILTAKVNAINLNLKAQCATSNVQTDSSALLASYNQNLADISSDLTKKATLDTFTAISSANTPSGVRLNPKLIAMARVPQIIKMANTSRSHYRHALNYVIYNKKILESFPASKRNVVAIEKINANKSRLVAINNIFSSPKPLTVASFVNGKKSINSINDKSKSNPTLSQNEFFGFKKDSNNMDQSYLKDKDKDKVKSKEENAGKNIATAEKKIDQKSSNENLRKISNTNNTNKTNIASSLSYEKEKENETVKAKEDDLKEYIKNRDRNAVSKHRYETNEEDTLFEKVNKAYVRNYDKLVPLK